MSKTQVKKPWWSAVAHFAASAVVGTAIFLIIGSVAVLLSFLVHWLEGVGVPPFTIAILAFLEGALTLTDAILFVVFLAVSLFRAIKEFTE